MLHTPYKLIIVGCTVVENCCSSLQLHMVCTCAYLNDIERKAVFLLRLHTTSMWSSIAWLSRGTDASETMLMHSYNPRNTTAVLSRHTSRTVCCNHSLVQEIVERCLLHNIWWEQNNLISRRINSYPHLILPLWNVTLLLMCTAID